MEDDDPPIKTHAASKEYRDNWDRIFGEPAETPAAAAVREHLASGGERSPIGYYGVVAVPPEVVAERDRLVEACRAIECPWERRAIERTPECSTCGAKGAAPCDDDIHDATGKPYER